MKVSVSFPAQDCIRVHSEDLFSDPRDARLRRFLESAFGAAQVTQISVRTALERDNGNGNGNGRRGAKQPARNDDCWADIRFGRGVGSLDEVVESLVSALRIGSGEARAKGGKRAAKAPARKKGRGPEQVVAVRGTQSFEHLCIAPDGRGVVRLYREGPRVTAWETRHEITGRIRLANPALFRRKAICQSIERELMSALGVSNYKASPMTGTVLIVYDPKIMRREQLLEILDRALAAEQIAPQPDGYDLDFPLCTASVPLAATAQFLVPAILPVAAALFAYTAIESFKGAYHVLFKERRLGVDVLDSIVVVACLGTGSIFAGSILCWCLSFGRILVKKTRDDSKRMLLNVFGKQARYVWVVNEDGTEIETPLEELRKGDRIAVQTGEAVPVDGIVAEGMAMIDQHALTGESTPAEKGIGDRVYAATMMVAGKIIVHVDRSGNETASAKISEILNNSAGYTMATQQRGEILADRAVIPTLSLGALALATMGPQGATAVLNSDFGTGIRMAAPLGMLTSLTLCAHRGILVKDGRALEMLCDIDTVLFDKTGTLTRERPEVGRVLCFGDFGADEILQFAAAAEQRFAHPIARAILTKAAEQGLELPPTDESKYAVGYGITVGVRGHTIRVGSARFIGIENIPMPAEASAALEHAHGEGNTLVMVAVDDALAGALELRAAERPEVRRIVTGLRQRGLKHLVIISGDHDAPTRKLATSLGMDRYFAGVLPEDKASYVEKLQAEGRKVLFVGDGINDSIALKKANVSISLRGASSIATDTAQIVFMEESLSRLCDTIDISRDLDRNVSRSWKIILAPNILCIAGAFFAGFGVMASVLTNNVAALGALANGMAPLRRIARERAEAEVASELAAKAVRGG